jgi:hypothetical protein
MHRLHLMEQSKISSAGFTLQPAADAPLPAVEAGPRSPDRSQTFHEAQGT